MSRSACRSVLMVGTDLAGTGGIRAVVQGYIDGGLFERFPCVYVTTHRNGSTWLKLRTAVAAWIAVAFELVRLEAPLVHVQTASRASFWRKSVVCLLARAFRRPYLLHVHGGGFVQFYERECSRPAQRLVRSIFAHAALVIALSEEWRSAFLRICPAARVEVLPNAVAVPNAAAVPEATALPDAGTARDSRTAPPAEGDRTLLFLGDVSAAKGVLDLIRAVSRIAGRFPQLKLVCAGRGAIDEARDLARRLGVADRLLCPGWLDPERKRAALAAASAFILPSYAEGMPIALLEAMSFGLPVIASRVGGIPQVVEDGANGLLVEPGDVEGLAAAIARLLEDPSLGERLGAAARSTVERRFSLDSALARLAGIYARFGLEPGRRTSTTEPSRAASTKEPARGVSTDEPGRGASTKEPGCRASIGERALTAYELYFGEPPADPERLRQREDAFFGGIWIRNGTSKLTYRGRFDDLDALVQPLLPAARPLDILDVAVSSGVSTAEWLQSLERAGIACRMVGGDAVIDAFLVSVGEAVRLLIDQTGFLMHLEIAGRTIRLPPPRRCGVRLHLHLLNALRAASAPALRAVLTRLRHRGASEHSSTSQRSFASQRLFTSQPSPRSRRRMRLSCRALKLVSPSLATHGSIEWVEDDVLRDRRFPQRFHVVRAANLLNRRYFDEPTLERMLANLRERLRPLGLLVVCRTVPAENGERRNHATVFRLEPDGRFRAVGRLNEGSEIADLVLGLPAAPRWEPTGAVAVRAQ